MSKHSKWSKIKHHKGPLDVKRSGVFTKLSRVITVAAREGGGDPLFNFGLRTAIDRALAANVPKDNIDRAIAKGTGGADGVVTEEVVYEGFGPGGVGILVTALTDSRNRTSANVRHIFSKHGGNFATSGAVQRMFDHKGMIRLPVAALTGEQELALIDAGAEDIAAEEEEMILIMPIDRLKAARDAAEASGLQVGYVGIEWLARDTVEVADVAAKEVLEALMEELDSDDDVNEVYSTVA